MTRIATIPLVSAFMLVCATSLSGQATVDLRAGVTKGTVAAGSLGRFDQAPRTSYALGLSVTVPLRPYLDLRLGGAPMSRSGI